MSMHHQHDIPANQPARNSCQLTATSPPRLPWQLILGGLTLFTTAPAIASVTQLWNGTQSQHSCVVTSSGGVKCWGYGGYGQLGDGTTSDHYAPVDVKDSTGTGLLTGVTAITVGGWQTCALLTGGAVKCWGSGLEGQVGDGANIPRSLPVDVLNSAGTAPLTGVMAVTAGYYHTCALMTGGGAKCWGNNPYGELGDGTVTQRNLPVDVMDSTGAVPLTGVTTIIPGGWHTCAMMTGGVVKCWGGNGQGQLGDGAVTHRYLPVDVQNSAGTGFLTGVTAMSGGYFYTCALVTGGGVKCWGDNPYGQLGDGTVTQRWLPVDVLNSTGIGTLTGVTAIATGLGHTCALLTGGGVKCWGYNADGQPGDNSIGISRLLPVDTKDLAGTGILSNVIMIATGIYHSCALLGSGGGTSETSRVYCWGYNANGRVGDNTAISRLIPVIVNDTAPTATSVTLSLNSSGTPVWVTGETLRGNYTYIDADGEVEGSSLFKWYQATDATCTTAKTVITGATSQTYTVTSSEEVKYVCFEVTPVASLGVSPGIAVLVTSSAPIIAGQTITFVLPTSATVGDAPLTLTATGGASGNPVTFASTTPSVCTVSGTTLTLVSAGTCTVTADQAGNANYHAATQVSQNLTLITVALIPDINIRQGSTNIPTSGSFEVGPSGIGYHVHHTFTIDNLGNSDLILSGSPKIRVSGVNASEFSIDDTATTSPIVAGTSTTFILTFIPTSVGNKTATLTIVNNDGDEGNYTVTVTGSAEPHKNLQVTVAGSGQGTVTSNPEGMDCEVTGGCLMPVMDAPQWVYLTAVPATGSIFTGWSGDPACQADGKVFVMANTACVATFELQSYELTVGRFGQGKVTGPGFDCPPDCTETVLYGTEIQLEAVADREWIHTGWKGSCDQTGKVKLTNAPLCQAIFQEDPAVPNQLDGNGDGIPDAHQPNVISLPDKVGGNYVTFAIQPDTCVIGDVYTDLPDNYGKPEKNKPMPQGVICFELACRQAQISLYYHAVSTVKRNAIFRKFGPLVPGDEQTIGWYLLPNVTFEAVMIGGKSVVKASYTLTDGELGDSTGVDGRIVDPGGVVVK